MELNVGIFFDGTGNNRNEDGDFVSNVGKLSHLYKNNESDDSKSRYASLYVRGVGTVDDGPGDPIDDDSKLFGAAFGTGGKKRIDYILERLENLITGAEKMSIVIDIFGFSRGSALARSFINIVTEQKHQHLKIIESPSVRFRFVGIYDTVGSFGKPGDDNDPYNFHLDQSKAQYIYHITSQDELRANFDSQSLKTSINDVLNFPSEPKDTWMVEEAMPGVHSDIGGGYASKVEQGNNNNHLSKVYLHKMHKVACRQKVPFKSLVHLDNVPAINGNKIAWKVNDELSKKCANLMGYYANDARLLRLHQPLKDSERHLEVVEHNAGKRSARNNSRRRLKKLKMSRLNSRIECLRQLIIDECFAGDNAAGTSFFDFYKNFRDSYIHLSHSPNNTPVVMAAQYASRDKKSDVELVVNKVGKANKLNTIFKRDIFYNLNDQATQFIEERNSITCHLQFVMKSDSQKHFPAGVQVDVWDDDMGRDDKLGIGTTDKNGSVSILCFDIDDDQDLYFAFDGQGEKLRSHNWALEEYWESNEYDCLADLTPGEFKEGSLDNHNGKDVGSKANPLIIYV